MRKTKNYDLKKKTDYLEKLHPEVSEKWKEEKQRGMWVFSAKI